MRSQKPIVDMSWQLDPATAIRRVRVFKAHEPAGLATANLALPTKSPNSRARPECGKRLEAVAGLVTRDS